MTTLQANDKLVLHIGYSKTATTTLQNSIFIRLHEQGVVNYLGIAKTPPYNFVRPHFKRWLQSDLGGGAALRSLLREKIPDEGPINLISEESILNSFTFPPRFFNPEEVKELFCPLVSQTKVVIVLRNQADLMESLFAHAHGWKSQGRDVDHSDLFIQTCFTESKTKAYFNFFDVISRYKTVFGNSNVEVMLFEDFKYEQDLFLSRWASVFNVSSGQLKEFLIGHHWNQKARDPDGSYIVVKQSDSFLLTAFKVLRQSLIVGSTYDFVKTLGLFDPDRISLWLRKLQATEEILIPPFTSEQKRLIKEQFRYSNAELPTLIGCEHEKLKSYGYI